MNRAARALIAVLLGSLALAQEAKPARDSRAPTAKEAAELLAVVCPGASQGNACKPCPAFTSFKGEDDALTLSAVTYGRFSDAKATDAILNLSGCEPHVNNFGGSVRLRWQGLTNWKFLEYSPGDRANDCLKFPLRDGREALVCSSYYANMGVEIEGLGMTDYAKAKGSQFLMSVSSNLGQCFDRQLQEVRIGRFARRDLNRDGRPDLEVEVSEARATAPKNWKCEDGEAKMPVATRHRLEFYWDGVKFTPSAKTRALLPGIEAGPK